MRVTNKMITTGSINNINKNKELMSKLESQYSSGKKIQKPSDDPIIAVRALKLRTNLSEVNQYYKKNIPDAQSWINTTEGVISTLSDIATSMNSYCNQGANDTLATEDRDAIAEDLQEMIKEIYQSGNTNYAGRYVFSGFKTNTSLIYNETTSNLKYSIKQNFVGSDIDAIKIMSKEVDIDTASSTIDNPETEQIYRLRLAYNNLSSADSDSVKLSYYLNGDTENELEQVVTVKSKDDTDAYSPADGEVYLIKETGELIFSSTSYITIKDATSMNVEYEKNTFEAGDLRPENYFTCTTTERILNDDGEYEDNEDGETIYYTLEEKQEIKYDIGYSQKIIINTMGYETITHDIGRSMQEVVDAINDVKQTEVKISDIKKLLEDKDLTEEEISKYNDMLEKLDIEKTLKESIMQEKFEKGITATENYQDTVTLALADLGSRSLRLELSDNRMADQQVSATELLSDNEDADLAETIINYTSATNVYTSSLSAASKIVQNSLLDFL